jgi:hypothetical protein
VSESLEDVFDGKESMFTTGLLCRSVTSVIKAITGGSGINKYLGSPIEILCEHYFFIFIFGSSGV